MTGSEVGKTIWWFLLAGVLIQASWFLIWATMDIEKITTAAAGSLPALVIQENSERWSRIVEWMTDSNILNKKMSLDSLSWSLVFSISTWSLANQNSNESILDAILPSYNSLSWPLYFIGFSIFRFQDYAGVSFNSLNNAEEISQVLTATTIKILIQLAFVIFMFLLVLINVVRIWYLWLVIALSPIIVLLIVMKEIIGIDLLKDKLDAVGIKIDIPTILAYIFQPTIIVIFMSLTLIAVTALWQWMWTGDLYIQDYAWLTITNTGATHPTFEFSSQGDVFDNFTENGRWVFKNLIMMGMVLALLLWMIIMSAKALKIKFIENIATSLWKALTDIPMIPIVTMQTFGKNELAKAGINISDGNIRFDQKAGDDFREMLWLKPDVSAADIHELQKHVRDPINFFNYAQSMSDKRDGLPLKNNPAFQKSLVELINNVKWNSAYWFSNFDQVPGLKDENGASKLKDGKLDVAHLQDYLSFEPNRQALYQWMYKSKYESWKNFSVAPEGSTHFNKKEGIMDEKFIRKQKKASS